MRDAEGISHALTNLAFVTWTRGGYDETSEFLRENLRMARATDYKLGIQYSLLGFGSLAMVRKRFGHAARLWGAAEAKRRNVIEEETTGRLDFGALREAIERRAPDALLAFYAEDARLRIENAALPDGPAFEIFKLVPTGRRHGEWAAVEQRRDHCAAG